MIMIRKVVTNVNAYFFDVEDHEGTDWTAIIAFYGVLGLAVIIAAFCLVGLAA